MAGYFWGQSEEQKAVQPPSVSGLGVMYTDTKSWAVGLGQALYWDEDAWRLTAMAGIADLKLPLLAADVSGVPVSVDWKINGALAYAQLSRKLLENWYVGLQGRYIDFDQTFSLAISSNRFDLPAAVRAVSLGPRLSRDSGTARPIQVVAVTSC